MKKSIIVFITVCLFLSSGCVNNSVPSVTEPSVPVTTTNVSQTSTTAPQDNIKAVSSDNNYDYFVDVMNYADYSKTPYKKCKLNVDKMNGEKPAITLVTSDYKAYLSANMNEYGNAYFGEYDLKTDTYRTLMKVGKGSQVALFTADEDYIVWQEGYDNSDWKKTRWHLYNKKNGKDKMFYTCAQDPENGYIYADNFSVPLLWNGCVYFDDVVGMKEDIFQVNLYCYNIAEDKVTMLVEQGKRSTVYKNKLAYLGPDLQDSAGAVLYTYDAGVSKKIMTIPAGTTALNTYDNLIMTVEGAKSATLHELFKDRFDCSLIQVHQEGASKVLACGKATNYIEQPQANATVISFQSTEFRYPTFYDRKLDKVVKLNEESNEFLYAQLLTDKFIIFSRYEDMYDENNGNVIYILVELPQ